MLDLAQRTRRRRIGLTPMIDVVFLLLVFFMLAARFGMTDAVPVSLSGGAAQPYDGPPRLVTIRPGGMLVNGVATDTLAETLAPLMATPQDVVILRARDGASVQDLLDAMALLRGAGWSNLVVVE
ncbi:biopolymer transporter ExbD [Marivita sp.]|uniref:ExbD/TolR family protein n=1 Tax=Marivita sp. TaxID=2003365 RepID=UPI0025B7B62B|nr:biopolymer transporter ExbD [Marivita sp.]